MVQDSSILVNIFRKGTRSWDFFEKFVSKGGIFGIEFNSYFIDIGVPNDYEKAQIDLRDILWYY